jgi:lysophospholipase L1-like esterase
MPFDARVSELRKRYYRGGPDERWRRMVAALRGLGRVTGAHGIRLVVAIVPDGDQIDVDDPDREPQRRVRAACAEAGVACIDLAPDFEAASEGEGSLFLDIMHPNAAGHAVIAARLADALLGAS